MFGDGVRELRNSVPTSSGTPSPRAQELRPHELWNSVPTSSGTPSPRALELRPHELWNSVPTSSATGLYGLLRLTVSAATRATDARFAEHHPLAESAVQCIIHSKLEHFMHELSFNDCLTQNGNWLTQNGNCLSLRREGAKTRSDLPADPSIVATPPSRPGCGNISQLLFHNHSCGQMHSAGRTGHRTPRVFAPWRLWDKAVGCSALPLCCGC